jgi:hypothetical protein
MKTESIKQQLAHALGRRDEIPNTALAEKICASNDRKAVDELLVLLQDKKKEVRHDAIKVLYEIGERKPTMIHPHASTFLAYLETTDNRMQWGVMSALSAISKYKPETIGPYLSTIVDVMDNGSVITRDHGMYVLMAVAGIKKFHRDCLDLMLEQLEKAPVNQFPMYAEKTAEVMDQVDLPRFLKILQSRQDVLVIPSKQKRMEKLMKSIAHSA